MTAVPRAHADVPGGSDRALLVDIVVNNHNYGRFLRQAVDSALDQSYEIVNVIVVDDGSTDDSRDVLADYRDRVDLVLKANGGQASTLNAGFSRCTGDVVIFLDADDLLHPDAAALATGALAADPGVVKVQYRLQVVDADGLPTGAVKPPEHLPLPNGDVRRAELAFPFDLVWMATSGNAFRTKTLRRIMPIPEREFAACPDWYLVHLTALLGPVVSLRDIGGSYRVHGGNAYEPGGATVDVAHIRQTVACAAVTSTAIRRLAGELGLEERSRGPLAVSDVANRLISVKLEPAAHPVPSDRVRHLAVEGMRAALGRFDVSWVMRALFVAWFAMTALAPRALVPPLAESFLFPQRRRLLNAWLGRLHRRSDGQRSSSSSRRDHYDVEVELAGRIRHASREERLGGLYAAVYSERLARISNHPLVLRSKDTAARRRAMHPQLRLLRPFLTPTVVFMEVGPGDCALAVAVAARVSHVYAVDVSEGLLDRSSLPPNVDLVHTGGVAIAVPAGTVDVAYSNQVLEHLHPDDAEEHVRAIYSALAPGGRFICITPNRLSGPWDISRTFDEVSAGLHLKEYTISELADLLRRVGFDVSLMPTYHGHRLLPAVPEFPLRLLEHVLERLPHRVRCVAALPLAAVKVVATKAERPQTLQHVSRGGAGSRSA